MRNATRRSPHAAVLAAALATASLTGLTDARAAAPAPYTAWSFDAKRAQDTPEALTKLAQAKPGFARVWFYGQVLDLATPGLSEAVKGPLRARLARVADALANGAEPDPAPRVLLDRVVGARASALAEQCRALEDELVANAKTGTPVSASVAAATAKLRSKRPIEVIYVSLGVAGRLTPGVLLCAFLFVLCSADPSSAVPETTAAPRPALGCYECNEYSGAGPS